MIRRLPPPPFGKALMQSRRRGNHPLCVHVIYGYKWRAPCVCWWQDIIHGEHPLLAVKPSEYAAGRFDWSVVTGLQVSLFDQEGAVDPGGADVSCGPPARWWHSPLYSLVGELAQFAADVEIYSPLRWKDGERWAARALGVLARAENRGAWPHWWSLDNEHKNAERIRTWTDIVFGERTAAPAAA